MEELHKSPLPRISFLERYFVTNTAGTTVDEPAIIETERSTTSRLMDALNPSDLFRQKRLSDAAKMSDDNVAVVNDVDRLLPETAITARLIQQSQMKQPVGTTKRDRDFPYKMRAIGFVNPHDILNGKGVGNSSLVSLDYELTP